MIAELRHNGQGLRAKLRTRVKRGGKPPVERGKIKGWSLSSRRRFRDLLLLNRAPDGWQTYSLTLTVPPLPLGSPSPCIDKVDTGRLWHAFSKAVQRRGHLAIWRLEIQSRTKTKREDIRGVPQPHWHIIGACPSGDFGAITWLTDTWLRLLGERGKVAGADRRAVDADWCESWSDGQLRYLYDHASKVKAEQVADGWGRHWGVIGRKYLTPDEGQTYVLRGRDLVDLWRLLRRLHRRRVPDRRGRGGVNWSDIEIRTARGGCDLLWLGGRLFVPSMRPDDVRNRKTRLELERRITRMQGLERDNVWALRGGKNRRGLFGQWFGAAGTGKCLRWVLDKNNNTLEKT